MPTTHPPAAPGFTMVELITTIILVGILTAVAVPRILAPSPFKVRALADEIAAEIRYTQQLNMNYGADATFRIVNGQMFIERDGSDRLHLRSRQNDGHDESNPYRELPRGVDIDPFDISFTRLGQPLIGSNPITGRIPVNIRFTDGSEETTLCIEPETGFVDVRHGSGSCP